MALPPNLTALAEELHALGGGDARVGAASVLCRIRPAQPGAVSVVETEPLGSEMSLVRVRDPRCPKDTPEAEAVRKFRVSAGGALEHSVDHIADADEAATHLYEAAGASALEWPPTVRSLLTNRRVKARCMARPRVFLTTKRTRRNLSCIDFRRFLFLGFLFLTSTSSCGRFLFLRFLFLRFLFLL